MDSPDFDAPSLDELRQRRSAKWTFVTPDVVPAFVAEADVPLAPPITAALARAVELGDTGYAYPIELADTVAGWVNDRYGRTVQPADVRPLPDVMVGVSELLRAATEPGDGVVINPPVYPPFAKTVTYLGRHLVDVPLLSGPDGWALDLDGLETAFRDGARAYLLCSPHNPVGAVWSARTLAAVAELADRYGVFVVADEIHGPIILPGAEFVPYATVSEAAADHSVTLVSASKAWNLAGLKAAAMIATSERTRGITDRTDPHVQWGVGHFGALAMTAALRDGQPWLDGFLAHLDRNRALLGDLLADRLPQVRYVPPTATFLAWLDCRALDLGDDPAEAFHARGRVALSHGPEFGEPGRGFARLNFATTADILAEIVDRMAVTTSSP